MKYLFKIAIMLLFSLGVTLAQQEYVASVNNPVMGSISPSNASVQVGETVVFHAMANEGYEIAEFKRNGISNGGGAGFLSEIIDAVEPTVSIEAVFRPVSDDVAPASKIISPDKSTIIKSGDDNSVNVTFITDDAVVCSLFNNNSLVSSTPVSNGDGTSSFLNVTLNEGDNVIYLKVSDASGNYAADFLMAHYSAGVVDNVRAVILIDSRLMAENDIASKMNEYCNLASAAMGTEYDINLISIDGIDDWNSDQVKNYILNIKNDHPFLEGIMFVGNIKLPSYYKPRGDYTQSRLITHKYEDLDIVLDNVNNSDADYDFMAKGQNVYPELWNAYLPVGFGTDNTYARFAVQVNAFLDKVINYYKAPDHCGNLYKVSNQLWDLSAINAEWGSKGIDFYGVNNTGYAPYQFVMDQVDANIFYKKAPIDTFENYAQFSRDARRWPWMGEEWQKPNIFKSHMESNLYNLVWVNVHSNPYGSLIGYDIAKDLKNGGLIVLGSGCSIAGLKQPGSISFVDGDAAFAEHNISMNYLYGSSNTISTLGCTFNRAHESEYQRLSAFLAQGDYLGMAHFFRKCIQYKNCDAGGFPLNAQEILLGNPFVKINNSSLVTKGKYSFGAIVSGKSRTLTANIKNNSNESVTINGFNSNRSAYSILEQNVVIEAGSSASITISCSPTVVEDLSGELTLMTDKGGDCNITLVLDAECIAGMENYLSDMEWQSATTGFGTVQIDKSGDGSPIILGGVEYNKGLGVHSHSEIIYNLNKQYNRFTSFIGVDDDYWTGKVKFEVYGDNVKLYESPLMESGMKEFIDVLVANVSILKLVVTDGDGITNSDFADWADAKVISASGIEYKTITATVIPNIISGDCTVPLWENVSTYNGGEEVSYNGSSWRAKWWTQGETPGVAAVWELIGDCVSSDTLSWGSIIDSGIVTVEKGLTKQFHISANSGYRIKDVIVDGLSVGAVSLYTFSNVNDDHTIDVTFEEDVVVITGDLVVVRNVSSENGEVTGGGTYNINTSINISATAKTGYRFVRWEVKTSNLIVADATAANTTVTILNNNETAAIEAIFEAFSGCTTVVWNLSAAYNSNDVVCHNGYHWRAKWWTQGAEPGTTGEWGVWENIGACE